ncbi:MbtH family NRPS accessory protein [Pseudoclavibacter sp. RFBA6]|uniref:MbtH family NRPS accessory protein n=1 Tax=Pseudoclavibacter sp. RFBA6 TaxID=2080573 RepID=UPI000CE7A5BC|nr:MbtH family NRPS accessory protein [Pseudoclavibacter sp. RFBA6]PPG37533.1 MbtH family protein [Pseudoclavibacter sp. RFBA6]
MNSPLEPAAPHVIVVGDEQGHLALWPDFVAPPVGWAVEFGPAFREECLAYVEGRR